MQLTDIRLHKALLESLERAGIKELRPAQEKAINQGLMLRKNLLVCTPTASGKTLIAEIACMQAILEGHGKAVYVVPLKALANEKFNDFKKRYGHLCKVALAIGDVDSADLYLADYDFIICTAEKLDSLLRHQSPWVKQISIAIIDEIRLLNDVSRGPTLEILITLLRQVHKGLHIIALSATIGNAKELASWLEASLVVDSWRPVPLHHGTYRDGVVTFHR